MVAAELKEIKDYWAKKYPTIDITLYSNGDGCKLYGKMIAHNCSLDIQADTVGDLINQGESFLRKVTI